jgi:hypothetical protein
LLLLDMTEFALPFEIPWTRLWQFFSIDSVTVSSASSERKWVLKLNSFSIPH